MSAQDDGPSWALIPIKQYASSIGIHYHTARKLKKDGKLRTVKVGRQDFVPVEEAKRVAKEGAG